MPTNQAAWLVAQFARPLEVKPAPYTPPGENEIVVKNSAVAINPVDGFKQDMGDALLPWIQYPTIMGSDVAGEVVDVGTGVTRFKVGDRVVGHAVGRNPKINKNSEGGFQEYTVLRTNMASPIPSSMSYETACVVPLGLSTAACGLFMEDYLALPFPTLSPKPTGKTLLIWGGSTSVGCNAIQLAVAAGYEVIATSSPKNFDLLKSLGAVEVFDYRSETVVRDIVEAFRTRESAGAFAIGNGSKSACVDIVGACKGTKFVSQASVDAEIASTVEGIQSKFITGSALVANEVGKAIYEDFLPAALAEGRFIPAPEPQIVGKGLEYIQEAMDLNKQGVSAKKLVVTL